ncbi:hypothetical protein [Maribacter sp. 2304DJ31-5]|uniref:hypothetical protein n=1 Tax=Maribacter sp. 2304DJ31-5 TaxID=3386273 RepID=UPI0039BC335C
MADLYKQVSVPIDLYNAVTELGLSKIQTNKAFRFLDLLITDSQRRFGLPYCYVSFSYGLFLTVFNSKYQNFLKPLLHSGIVKCDEVFSSDGQKPHYYKVHKDLSVGEGQVTVQVKYKGLEYNNDTEVVQNALSFIKSLYIPYGELKQALLQKLYDVIHTNYKANHAIKESAVRVFDGKKHYYINTQKAIAKATKLGVTLFEDDGRYFIMDKGEYLKIKTANIKRSYVASIENLRDGNYYASRNHTNNRLDHNLTNMATVLRYVIAEANNLVQVDAVNSQYAILANQMKKEGIKGQFIEDAIGGRLYENVVEGLNLPDRNTGKNGLMKVVFAPIYTPNTLKSGLEKMYPELIRYSDKIKQMKGYNQLAVMLQQHESALYVDSISAELQKMGISCTTIHDSILCRENDRQFVQDFIKQKMKEQDFECQLKAS